MLVSATCEKFVSAFLVLGAEEGGEDRVLLAEKAAQGESNVLCVIENMLSCFFSSRGTWMGRVRLSSSIFETRSSSTAFYPALAG
jgi:hypothetical protein